MSWLKTTRKPDKSGGICLTLNEFAILMRHEICDLKKMVFAQNLSCFSNKISEKSETIWDNQ